MKTIITTILLTFSILFAQGITNTLGGDSSSDKFILQNSSGTVILTATGSGEVGIGYDNPLHKLQVDGNINAKNVFATRFHATSNAAADPSVIGWNYYSGSSSSAVGGHFGSESSEGAGVQGSAKKYGVKGRAEASSGLHYGGFFETANPSGRGIYATNTASSGSAYGGVFEAKNSTDGVGVWADGKKYDFYAAGAGTDYGAASSIRWKNNIVEIDNPLEKISQIRGVYFDWDEEHGGIHDVGCIAEEVGKVLPEIVTFEANGIDAEGMDYSKLTPLLIEAVKALEKRVAELEATQ